MSEYTMKLHDVGEGVAEAEIVEWHVAVGELVTEDDVIAEVMSDKATIELYAPLTGTVTWLAGDAGDIVAIGADLIRFTLGPGPNAPDIVAPDIVAPDMAAPDMAAPVPDEPEPGEVGPVPPVPVAPVPLSVPPVVGGGTLAAPAVRLRARQLGIELGGVSGSGPHGRVVHADLDAAITARTGAAVPGDDDEHDEHDEIEAIKVIGLRRNIAERMQAAKRRIPHFTYVEEVDMTELERLRRHLNTGSSGSGGASGTRPKLTVLPFLIRAIVIAVGDHPEMNARFDDEAGFVNRHREVHLGVAVQTPRGLMVPVLRSAGQHDLWSAATEVARLSEAARTNTITLPELNGSTITITSLGALGGIVSTPVINAPEVAIIGINKISTRPVYVDGVVVPREMMNLSSSFDHRVIDGSDAAAFIQRIKVVLETPALAWVR